MDEPFKNNKVFLVVVLLEKQDLLLTLAEKSILLMSITESVDNQAICVVEYVEAEEENCLFSKSLLDATM